MVPDFFEIPLRNFPEVAINGEPCAPIVATWQPAMSPAQFEFKFKLVRAENVKVHVPTVGRTAEGIFGENWRFVYNYMITTLSMHNYGLPGWYQAYAEKNINNNVVRFEDTELTFFHSPEPMRMRPNPPPAPVPIRQHRRPVPYVRPMPALLPMRPERQRQPPSRYRDAEFLSFVY